MTYNDVNKIIHDDLTLVHDMIDFFCGERLGSGSTRDVYVFRQDPKWVIKIENGDANGDNWAEWRIWQSVCHADMEIKGWFAECSWISTSGRIMLQKRTEPLETKSTKIPDKIPSWFTDIKASNFGWIGNRVVCHDYSLCIERFSFFALKPSKLQKFNIDSENI